MTGRMFKSVMHMLLLFQLFASPLAAIDEQQALEGVVRTLDLFMVAGKEGDPKRGAALLNMYESSPRKAEKEIGIFFEERQEVFSKYVSISKDIYGFELTEKGYLGPNIELEGRIETVEGLTAEFNARLVFRDQIWRILNLEID